METNLNLLDRFALAVSPSWGQNRIRARMIANTLRHYEAAAPGRRTANWARGGTDANAAAGPALATLRALARDLTRNNAWARNGLRTITGNVVGWGITAKSTNREAIALWKQWAESKECDSEGRNDIYGLEVLALRAIVESGEVLVRRRWRRASDGLSIPMQLQVLEPDFLDTTKDGMYGVAGGPIVQGVEFDMLGRRVAYWLFDQHPGAARFGMDFTSKRVSADDVIHVFLSERVGQVRGVSWLAPAIVNLRDFDEFEDASLMRQKIAACFAAFVTDIDGAGPGIGDVDTSSTPIVETLEPGLVSYLKPGQNVAFASPPAPQDSGFSAQTLRRIAAAIGVTYEDLTGDYSQVNFSSARMSRIAHWKNVHDWRWNMLIPQFCEGVWDWAMEVAEIAGQVSGPAKAEWTPPPMPMLEPDREGLALQRLVRTGAMTPDEMVRERGFDPETHWKEYANAMAKLDKLGIVLDCDARKTNQSGQVQSTGSGGSPTAVPVTGK
jgi:lambda family phage portal protein